MSSRAVWGQDVSEDVHHESEDTADHRGLFDVICHYLLHLSIVV